MYKCVCCCSIYGHEINLLDRRRVCRVDLLLCSHRNSFRWDFQNWPLDNSPCEKSRHEANRSHLVYLSLDYMFWTFAQPETCMWMRHYRISGIGRGCRSGMVWKNTKNEMWHFTQPKSEIIWRTVERFAIHHNFPSTNFDDIFVRAFQNHRPPYECTERFVRLFSDLSISNHQNRVQPAHTLCEKKRKNSRSCGKSYF